MVKDVYFLTVHDPRERPGGRPPVNGVIVHARTPLHPDLPQPDPGRVYWRLTEFPGRTPGCLVPVSTLDYELDDGRLWPQVADWEAVTGTLTSLTRTPGRCDSIPLALRPSDITLLATGPYAHIPVITEEGIALPESSGRPLLWPGDNLIPPPEHPATMPYQPHGT